MDGDDHGAGAEGIGPAVPRIVEVGAAGAHGVLALATVAFDPGPAVECRVAVDDSVAVVAGEALPTALVELIENAVVHNDDPEPTVRVTADTGRANVANDTGRFHPRDPVVVRVADDGPGIPEDERTVVAGDADVSALTHSDGLGLWTAVRIVEAYGGTLEVDDREGGGTVVEGSLVREE